MPEKRRVRPKIGDVVRVQAIDGRAADAQYIHKHPEFGALVRVLGPSRGADIPLGGGAAAEIAARPTQFVTFFPLGAACARGIAVIVGTAPVPAELAQFPLFRFRREGTLARSGPWLWDGQREWRASEEPDGYRDLPICQIVNDTLLVERAHEGWRHDSV